MNPLQYAEFACEGQFRRDATRIDRGKRVRSRGISSPSPRRHGHFHPGTPRPAPTRTPDAVLRRPSGPARPLRTARRRRHHEQRWIEGCCAPKNTAPPRSSGPRTATNAPPAPKILPILSAYWLRSSVVSVLYRFMSISKVTDLRCIMFLFGNGGVAGLAQQPPGWLPYSTLSGCCPAFFSSCWQRRKRTKPDGAGLPRRPETGQEPFTALVVVEKWCYVPSLDGLSVLLSGGRVANALEPHEVGVSSYLMNEQLPCFIFKKQYKCGSQITSQTSGCRGRC